MNFTMGGLNTNSNSVGQIYLFSEPNEKDDYEKYNNLNLLKMKHIEDMRNSILDYKLLRDKKMYLPSNISNINVTKSNIILFGPSGSGKSSFIKSLYRALYGTPFLPPDALNKLIVQGPYQNEGTLCFTRLHLKEEGDNSSGIVVSDTRGHIRMNDAEKEQFKVILEGKVKEDVKIVQKPKRDPMQLWEFWKKDTELFPKEIFNAQEPGLDSLPHIILLVFNGSEDEVIDTEDEKFYKDLIDMSYKKGYSSVHVILTRIDLFEKQIHEKHKTIPLSERTNKINTMKDQKIERVIDILGVQRSNIHFIENYHSDMDENIIEIDYQILKTLGELINVCEQFIINYLNRNATCFARCF